MNWQAYRLTFHVQSPLHIGYHDVGNLLRTRSYVPGRAVWGAVIAQLTRLQGPQSHQAVMERVNHSVRFSYYYPSLRTGYPEKALYPCFDAHTQQIMFGEQRMSQETFEGLFLTSYASTALNPFQTSAEEGSLHEVECLAPSVKSLAGYLFLRVEHDELLQDITHILTRLQLGGERAYGFGKVAGTLEPVQPDDRFFGLYEFDLSDASGPLIRITEASVPKLLLAHTCADNLPGANGDIEPVVGREWNETTQTYDLTPVKICWTPGSVMSDTTKTFEIMKQGLWHVR